MHSKNIWIISLLSQSWKQQATVHELSESCCNVQKPLHTPATVRFRFNKKKNLKITQLKVNMKIPKFYG